MDRQNFIEKLGSESSVPIFTHNYSIKDYEVRFEGYFLTRTQKNCYVDLKCCRPLSLSLSLTHTHTHTHTHARARVSMLGTTYQFLSV